MEQIRNRPSFTLAMIALVLGLFAVTRLALAPQGPACAEAPPAQPGFTALAARPGPACIRIRLP